MATKYQNYKKIANAPQKWLYEQFKNIKDWEPDDWRWQFVRVPGAFTAFNLYLTTWLFTRIGFENPIIEKLDEKNANKKIKDAPKTRFGQVINAIRKKEKASPTASAFIAYYFMLLSLFGGGKVAYDKKDYIKEKYIEWKQEDEADEQEAEVKQEVEEAMQNTFSAYREKLRPISPWLIAQLVAAEGVKMKDGMHIPYMDEDNGKWTIGFGSTILKDGTAVTEHTPPITTEEAYDLALWHVEERETFFYLYCYSVADQKLTVRNTGEAFGLSSIMYNSGSKFIEDPSDFNHRERFAALFKEYNKYGAAISDSVVAELFRKYPIVNKANFGKAWIDSHKPQDMADAIGGYMLDGAGMHWRRWLEAGLITGDIKPEDLLECPIKSMYDFYVYMGGKKHGKFALWKKVDNGITPIKSTYTAFREWLKKPQQLDEKTGKLVPITRKKVKDFIPEDILKECQKGKCEIGGGVQKRKNAEKIEKQTYTIGYEERYKTIMKYYESGNYVDAIKELEKLSAENPNNALLHNDLALMYNKTNNYDKAIQHTRVVLYQICDKSQYGFAQYNAGVAYEKLGELERALKNYKLSLTNGNVAARKAIKRVQQKLSKKKSKTIAFNEGIMKIKNKQKDNMVIYPFDNEHQA